MYTQKGHKGQQNNYLTTARQGQTHSVADSFRAYSTFVSFQRNSFTSIFHIGYQAVEDFFGFNLALAKK